MDFQDLVRLCSLKGTKNMCHGSGEKLHGGIFREENLARVSLEPSLSLVALFDTLGKQLAGFSSIMRLNTKGTTIYSWL